MGYNTRMFFFIGGVQPRTVTLPGDPRPCPNCGQVQVRRRRVDNYLSFFFIPLIRIRAGVPFRECGHCRAVFDEDGSERPSEHTEPLHLCRTCHKPLDPAFAFCPYCGRPVR